MQIRIQIKGDSIMKCQKCGSELRDGAKFCDNCGTAVLLKKQCPKCGRIIDSNAIYCPFCNSSILEKEAPKSKLANVEGLKNDFIKCPKCGNEYKATTPYCPTCGEKTSKPVQNEAPSAEKVSEEHLKNYIEYKKCPNCSEINDSKALFCKKCNYSLSDTPISTKDKKNNLQLIVSIGLIVAVVIILILVNVAINKPKDNKTPNKDNKSYSSLYEEPTTKREYTQPVTEAPTTEKPTEPPTEKEPETEAVPIEFRNALAQAERYNKSLHLSKQGLYEQLTSEYGSAFPADAAQYAVDNIDADWNENAVKRAESYNTSLHLSKKGLFEQLSSEHGAKFTEDEAQYALDHTDFNYKENAVKQAKSYIDSLNLSKDRLYEQLTSEYGAQFTAEEAQYAVEQVYR